MTALLIPGVASGGGFGSDAERPALTRLRLPVPGEEPSSDGKDVTQVISRKRKKPQAKNQQKINKTGTTVVRN